MSNITWIAKKPCGCVVAAIAYMPGYPKETERALKQWQQLGLAVEQTTDEWFRAHGLEKCGGHSAGQLVLGI